MRNIGRHSLGSRAESSWFGNQACHAFAARGKTIGCPKLASGKRCTRLMFAPRAPWPGCLGGFSWDSLPKWNVAVGRRCCWPSARPAEPPGNTPAQLALPPVMRLIWRMRGVRNTAEDVIDLNRIGGKAEFTYRNEAAVALVNHGLKVCFHFCSSAEMVYCGLSDFPVGMFPGVSKFNLA